MGFIFLFFFSSVLIKRLILVVSSLDAAFMLRSLKSTQSSLALDDCRITGGVTDSQVLLIRVRTTDKLLLFDLGAGSGPASRVREKNCIFEGFPPVFVEADTFELGFSSP